MKLKVAERGKISPFIVMDVMRSANERMASGHDVIHLEVGQPGNSTPKGVTKAVTDALASDRLGYTLALGRQELRERIALYYGECYGYKLDAERIAVTAGASGAFVLSLLAAFEVGDCVALASPSYPAYRNILSAIGVDPLEVPTGPETNFQLTPHLLDNLKKTSPIDGVIIASPSNPTGTMLTSAELSSLVSYCSKNQIRMVSDEIYHGITYSFKAETAIRYSDDVIVINSFSKYFSMTGWRLGWIVMPEELKRSIECLAQNLFIAPSTLSQIGGLAAFDCKVELEENLKLYSMNRDFILSELPKAGFSNLAQADGAFYVYADVSNMTNNSPQLCKNILDQTGVAITPGTDFDRERGNFYIRISFSGDFLDIREAMKRLKAWNQGN